MDLKSIVFLDAYTTNPGDLAWDVIDELGNFKKYDRTKPEDLVRRAIEAEIIIVNKVALSREILEQLPYVKCICIAATGYDKIDLSAASDRNIPVFNVRGYSSDAVAERVFAYMLHHVQHIDLYFSDFRQNSWAKQNDFSYWHSSIRELRNKTIGIIGLGSIGTRVAEIARAFNMEVVYFARSQKGENELKRKFVDLAELLETSDFVSIHLPLNAETHHIVNANFLAAMDKDAVLINTSRGDHIDEPALAKALKKNEIKAAYLDVLSEEPPQPNHLFVEIQNCFVSPHTAWASLEARSILVKGIAKNIRDYVSGNLQNALNRAQLI